MRVSGDGGCEARKGWAKVLSSAKGCNKFLNCEHFMKIWDTPRPRYWNRLHFRFMSCQPTDIGM